MLGPIFGALHAFLILILLSLLFAVASAILFFLKRCKAARIVVVLTGIFFAMTVLVYLEIWGFTWFG